MNRKLYNLQNLLGMVETAELAKLSQVAGDRRRLGEEISNLCRTRKHACQSTVPAKNSDMLDNTGVADRWLIWVDTELNRKMEQLALLSAQVETHKLSAGRAHGRLEAFRKSMRQR